MSEREQSIIEELERQFAGSPGAASAARSVGTTLIVMLFALVGLGLGALAALASTSEVEGAPLAGLILTFACVVVLGRGLTQLASQMRGRLARRR